MTSCAVTIVCIALCFIHGIRSQSTPNTACLNNAGIACVRYDDYDFPARSECGENPDLATAKCDELPERPDDVATSFLLYSKTEQNDAVELNTSLTKEIFAHEKYGFDEKKDLKILVQGVWSPNFYGLLEHIKEAFFAKHKFNIFMVNWVSINDVGTVDPKKIKLTYRRPAKNTRLVGIQLGKFLEYVHKEFNIGCDRMHLVGYNMGAHVAGYAGKYLKQKNCEIARITALGPSAPYFEFDNGQPKPPQCRLDKGDAKFVDVIHGDIPSTKPFFKVTLGMTSPIGHVDFYANNGKDPQPGCKHMFCSHARPMEFYEQSIKKECVYQSKPCAAPLAVSACAAEGCPSMGYGVASSALGVYCVDTTDKEPFCKKPKK